MVKLAIISCLVFWQLLPGFCNRDLNRVHRTVYTAQVTTCGLSIAMNRNPANDDFDIQQALHGGRAETKDNDTGLFVKALCEIIR